MKLVLGGGLGGLSAAHYLAEGGGGGAMIVERAARLGGWVRTVRDSGSLLETGPHTVRPAGPQGRNTLELVSRLGLADQVVPISRSHPAATRRLICVGDTLYPLPSSLMSLFKVLPPFSKPLAFSIIRDLFEPKQKSPDESAYDFIARRFGRDMAEYAISPMLCGICAGDAKEISIKSLLPAVHTAEQEHGSVVKGFILDSFKAKPPPPIPDFPDANKWSCWTLKSGMSTLIDSLAEEVKKNSTISMSSNVTNLDLRPGLVSCKINNKTHEFTHAIAAVPAHSLANLVIEQHPILAKLLNQIQSVTVAVVNLVYPGEHIKEPAFGFLVPPSEKRNLLGVIYDSCIMPQEGKTVLTAMLGGKWYNEYFGKNTTVEDIKTITLGHVKKILGISEEPECCRVHIHTNCIAQYTIGHSDRVNRIQQYILNNNLPVSLVGSSYFGVGVNDVILSAKKAAEDLVDL